MEITHCHGHFGQASSPRLGAQLRYITRKRRTIFGVVRRSERTASDQGSNVGSALNDREQGELDDSLNQNTKSEKAESGWVSRRMGWVGRDRMSQISRFRASEGECRPRLSGAPIRTVAETMLLPAKTGHINDADPIQRARYPRPQHPAKFRRGMPLGGQHRRVLEE